MRTPDTLVRGRFNGRIWVQTSTIGATDPARSLPCSKSDSGIVSKCGTEFRLILLCRAIFERYLRWLRLMSGGGWYFSLKGVPVVILNQHVETWSLDMSWKHDRVITARIVRHSENWRHQRDIA